jgi:hypothetical protein
VHIAAATCSLALGPHAVLEIYPDEIHSLPSHCR